MVDFLTLPYLFEFHVPNEEEVKLWRKGVVGAWVQSKGQYDPVLVTRILNAQGKMDFVKELEAAGTLLRSSISRG